MDDVEVDLWLAGGSSDEEQWEGEEHGISIDDLATTARTLAVLLEQPGVLQADPCKPVRKLLGKLNTRMQSRKYGGVGVTEYEKKKQLRREAEARERRRRDLDQKHINKTQLRRERLEVLEQLLNDGAEGGHEALPMIPDGVSAAALSVSAAAPALTGEVQNETQGGTKTISIGVTTDSGSEEVPELARPRACYVCKIRFTQLHHFYDLLCPDCASLNWHKRMFMTDLKGKVLLLTGGRVKIGFQCALRLLRCGATVIVTTRFPRDAAKRFGDQPDYSDYKDRLFLYGIDLRDIPSLQAFLLFFTAKHPRLDGIVHNACQTIRRPAAYYKPLLALETAAAKDLPPQIRGAVAADEEFHENSALGAAPEENSNALTVPSSSSAGFQVRAAQKTQVPLLQEDENSEDTAALFPEGLKDVNGQQIDLRTKNSWLLKVDEVATPEVAEVFAVNTLAPFIINGQLIPHMRKGDYEHRFIINVSAMEGKFYRVKSAYHPHTNMAKAALNMMTRTCSKDLAEKDRIYMNSVDTGWINDENPLEKAQRYAENHNFQTPIDEIDAASRVLDPILSVSAGGDPMHGLFLKDYRSTEW